MPVRFTQVLKGTALSFLAIGGFSPLVATHYRLTEEAARMRGTGGTLLFLLAVLGLLALGVAWLWSAVKVGQIVIEKMSGLQLSLPTMLVALLLGIALPGVILAMLLPGALGMWITLIIGAMVSAALLTLEASFRVSEKILLLEEAD